MKQLLFPLLLMLLISGMYINVWAQSETSSFDEPGRDLTGSSVNNITTSFIPGTSGVVLDFSTIAYSPDYEYVTYVELDFPLGVTVVSASGMSILPYNNQTGNGALISWGTLWAYDPFLYNVTVGFTVTVDIASTFTGPMIINWMIGGDVFGSPPHSVSGSMLLHRQINHYPYLENFEAGAQGWNSGAISGANHWQLGTPAQTFINSAHSGNNAWMTRLTSNYDNHANTWLRSPEFNFSLLSQPHFSVWLNMHCEINYDAMILESSVDNGATWQQVRADDTDLEFYNNNSTWGPLPPPKWSGPIGTWIEYSTPLPELAFESSVLFRFRFVSDVSITGEGFAVDDVRIFNSDVTVTEFPYFEDFETGYQGWTSGAISGANLWQLGTPAQSVINAAHSGVNAWMTGLTSNYTNNADTWLMSPIFDFSDLNAPFLSVWLNIWCEVYYDGMILESSIDDGTSWQHVIGDPGFYNNDSTAGYIPAPNWSGRTPGIHGIWTEFSTFLPQLANESSVRLRFRFVSDLSVVDQGMAIDDILIFDSMPGAIEGTVTLQGGSGDVTDVIVSAGGESVNPSADGSYQIPLYTGVYDVTAALIGYQSETQHAIEVFSDQATTGIDFSLLNIEIAVDPPSISQGMLEDDPPVTIPLTITNDGLADLNYSISTNFITDRTSTPTAVQNKENSAAIIRTHNPEFDFRAPYAISNLSGHGVYCRDLFDLLYHFPCHSTEGEYGVATDGNYIYTTRFNALLFYKYETDGTFIGQFSVPGVTGGVLGLTYDGQYFYGVAYNAGFTNIIYQLDLANETLVSQFTTTEINLGLAYDPQNDGFWVSTGFNPQLRRISRTGETLETLTLTISSLMGLGWDGVSEDGPFIWVYAHTGSISNDLHKIDLTTGSILQTFDLGTLGIINPVNSAGGMGITNQLVPGLWTFLGLAQNNLVWVMELAEAFPPWLAVNPTSGTVPAGQSVTVDLTFNAEELELGTYLAELIINNNAQADPVIVPVELNVVTQDLNPTVAHSPTPAHEAIDVPVNTPMGWSYSANHLFTDPIGYKVLLWTDDTIDDPIMIYVDGGPGVYMIHGAFILDYDTGYYWQVIPTTEPESGRSMTDSKQIPGQRKNSLRGDALNCPVWIFSTEEDTSVDTLDMPFVTELKGNYPNPFNPDTNIRFTLQNPGIVTLEIFNIRGRKVKTLFNEFKESGFYDIVWNGRDENNREVVSGIYLYRMKSGDYTATRKMILMK